MKRCLIIGRSNIGKTSFFLNFAEYLGVKNYTINSSYSHTTLDKKCYSNKYIKNCLAPLSKHKTTCLHSLIVDISVFNGKKQLEMIDSTGLTNGIHPDVCIRRSMAQTLEAMRECEIILHMIDIIRWDTYRQNDEEDNLDIELAKYGLLKDKGCVILANRVDLLDGKSKIVQLHKEFPHHHIIPISTVTSQGFGEVKTYLKRKL